MKPTKDEIIKEVSARVKELREMTPTQRLAALHNREAESCTMISEDGIVFNCRYIYGIYWNVDSPEVDEAGSDWEVQKFYPAQSWLTALILFSLLIGLTLVVGRCTGSL